MDHVDAGAVPLSIYSGPGGEAHASLRRPLAALTPYPDAKGWYFLVLAGEEEASGRTFSIYAPKSPPLTVGDVLEVRTRRVELGPTSFDEAVQLLDARGTLLAASFTGRAPLDGWSLAELPGAACRIAVAHAGSRVEVPANEWRRLRAPDGEFAVSVTCPSAPSQQQQVADDWVPESLAVRVSRLR